LGNRVARFITIVYEGPSFSAEKMVFKSEKNPWVKRKRSTKNDQNLTDAEWEVDWPVENIIWDIMNIRLLRKEDPMSDYFQFIIIDRYCGRQFTILEVADALMQLSRDPSRKQVLTNVICQSIPELEQEKLLEAAPSILLPSSALVSDMEAHGYPPEEL